MIPCAKNGGRSQLSRVDEVSIFVPKKRNENSKWH